MEKHTIVSLNYQKVKSTLVNQQNKIITHINYFYDGKNSGKIQF